MCNLKNKKPFTLHIRHYTFNTLVYGFMVFCLIVGTAFADLTPHMLARVEALAVGVRSYKANYDLILRVDEKELKLKGMVLYKWPRQMRNEMTVEGPLGTQQIIYWKEGIVWQYLPSSKVAFRQQEARLREKFPEDFVSQDLLNLQNPFDLVETKTIHFIEEQQQEGEAVYLFEGIPKKAIQIQKALAPHLCRFWISTNDGLLRNFSMYDENGQEIYRQRFWDIQINLELLDEEFEFRLPENVEVVEVTQETEKRLSGMAKEAPL